MQPWRDFWESEHSIYVSDRHRAVHYRQVADDLLSLIPERAKALVLDYGCGEALDAARVATRVDRLFLFDASRDVRDRLTQRHAATAKITVLDDDDLAALAPDSLDLIVVNSVIQYLSAAEFTERLARWRRLLRADGLLVIADVIPPDAGLVADIVALLRTGWRHGFLLAAVFGLVRTLFSDYRALRRRIGLATYDEAGLRDIVRRAGFDVARRARNFGFNLQRMTFLCRKLG
ncbi:MAG: methyltransferase domain-containing protein [Proteobacteria bacterium]|nr:methyltransferase domain-containing protein [Pseudomonadota bacterium]